MIKKEFTIDDFYDTSDKRHHVASTVYERGDYNFYSTEDESVSDAWSPTYYRDDEKIGSIDDVCEYLDALGTEYRIKCKHKDEDAWEDFGDPVSEYDVHFNEYKGAKGALDIALYRESCEGYEEYDDSLIYQVQKYQIDNTGKFAPIKNPRLFTISFWDGDTDYYKINVA